MASLTAPIRIAGNTTGQLQVNFPPRSIGITNPGSCWVQLPQAIGVGAWVPPRQYGVVIDAPISVPGVVQFDSTQVPSAAYVLDNSDLVAAQITVWEDYHEPSPGQSLLSFLPPSGAAQLVTITPNLLPTNLTQVDGISLTNWAMPWGTRWMGQSNGNLAVGTYTVLISSFEQAGFGGVPIITFGLGNKRALVRPNQSFPPSGRAALYCLCGANAGGGTCTFSLFDDVETVGSLLILATTALAANAFKVLRVAPGLPAVANTTANDLVGLLPAIQIVIATAPQSFMFTLDLM